jgi:hypothetical protein
LAVFEEPILVRPGRAVGGRAVAVDPEGRAFVDAAVHGDSCWLVTIQPLAACLVGVAALWPIAGGLRSHDQAGRHRLQSGRCGSAFTSGIEDDHSPKPTQI